MKNKITCTVNCKHRTAATWYTVETFFSFRNVIVNVVKKDYK